MWMGRSGNWCYRGCGDMIGKIYGKWDGVVYGTLQVVGFGRKSEGGGMECYM